MKTLTLTLLLFAFLTSCQIKAENAFADTNKIVEVQTSVSPTPSISPTAMPNLVNDINSKIGIVDYNQKKGSCLTIPNANLKKGGKVQIIFTDKPQIVLQAEVVEKLNRKCPSRNTEVDNNDSFYSLKVSGENIKEYAVAIGLIDSKQIVKVRKGMAGIDVDSDKKNDYFRICTSFEGLHLTVWNSKPLIGKRIWHRYYYLGYDVDSNCKEKDYEGTEN